MIAYDDFGSEYTYSYSYPSPMMVKVMYTSPPLADAPIVEPDWPEETAADLGSLDIDQLPFIFTDTGLTPLFDQSRDWLDFSLNLYDDNLYLPPVDEVQPPNKSGGNVIVQHNTFNITQNIINSHPDQPLHNSELSRPKRQQKIQPVYTESDHNEELEEDSESDMILSKLVSRRKKRVETVRRTLVPDKNEEKALKQLLSAESLSKQRKTILYVGKDSKNGHTIQKISFDDPQIQCSAIEVDHEVTIEASSSPKSQKKKFQCDQCKKIFDTIASFHLHVTGKHTTNKNKVKKEVALRCNDCGRNFKTYEKYQKHCLGHGDPDLECPKCHKVYASHASLKVHLKIHDRKFPCSYCSRTYATADTYQAHLKKSHSKYLCKHQNCSFVANSQALLNTHLDDHEFEEEVLEEKIVYDHFNNNDFKTVDKNMEEYIDHMQLDQINTETDFNSIFDEDLGDVESILLDEVKNEVDAFPSPEDSKFFSSHKDETPYPSLKDTTLYPSSKDTTLFLSPKEVEERQKIKEADAVIEKVLRSKIFQQRGKGTKKHDKKSKTDKTCKICGKSFDRTSDFKRHSIEHLVKATLAKTVSSDQGFLDILCLVCEEESFDSIDKYKAHLRKHVHLTTYQCTFCDKSFSDSSNFSKHKKIHGASHFQCDLCLRKFNSKAMLSRHMEYHKKNEPLQCQVCDKLFHFESMLKKHARTAHKVVSSKVYCTFCDKVLKTLREKWDHEWLVHNIRKSANDCNLCEARFRKYSELKKHYTEVHRLDGKAKKMYLKRKPRG